MRTLILLAAGGLLVSSSPALAYVVTIGSTQAESCYRAAEAGYTSSWSIQACDVALAADPLTFHDRVGTHVNRGILWMASGDVVRATQDFDRALALDPKQAEAWLNKAVVQVNSREIGAAGQMAERALALGTTKPAIAYYIRGIAHEDTGNIRAAYADLRRARELDPTWALPAKELSRYQIKSR